MRRFRAEKQRAQVTSAHCTGSASTRRDRVVIRRSAGIIMLGTCPHFPPPPRTPATARPRWRSEEHTSELQSLMRISYAVFCLKKKKKRQTQHTQHK